MTTSRGNLRKSIIRLTARPPGGRLKPDRRPVRPTSHASEELPRYLTQDELGRFLRAVKTGGSVRRLFKQSAAAGDLPAAVGWHSLRHSIAVPSLMEGYGVANVADLLGHRSIRSTLEYAKFVDPGREQMIHRLDRSRYVVSWS